MTRTELNTIAGILARHYALRGPVYDTEVRDEIRSLARKMWRGGLDDKSEYLCAQIQVATGRDVIELHKG